MTEGARRPLWRGKPVAQQAHLEVTFDDNRKLADVLGTFDSHLAIIEARLGINAVAHGNVIVIDGPEGPCLLARAVIETLYKRAESGVPLGPGDVEGAIRHARSASDGVGGNGKGSPVAEQPPAELRTRRRVIIARTAAQTAYIEALAHHDLVFGTGPAGTGKTYLAVAHAASCLERGEVERIVLSRPAVEAGERLGFLPGDMREKVDPYLRPLYDALYDVLAPERVERGLETKMIEIAPLAFMRGRTLSHAVIILDEAQNCTPMQMKMFLTRLGEGSKMIVTGDPSQVDLPSGQTSGLAEALRLLGGIEGIAHATFTAADVVRHPLVGRIVEAYESKR
jgi:phosphate starvation-inducible PhoH-like protein